MMLLIRVKRHALFSTCSFPTMGTEKTIILQNAMRNVNETVLQQHPFMYDY